MDEDRLTPFGRTADGNLNARMVLFWEDDLVDAFKKYLLIEPPLPINVEWEAYVSRYDTTSREFRGQIILYCGFRGLNHVVCVESGLQIAASMGHTFGIRVKFERPTAKTGCLFCCFWVLNFESGGHLFPSAKVDAIRRSPLFFVSSIDNLFVCLSKRVYSLSSKTAICINFCEEGNARPMID